MLYQTDRAWAEVSLDDIVFNFNAINEHIRPGCQVIAVIKADAYGHGAVTVAGLLERVGCKMFAVATFEEAIELREHKIKTPILLLCPITPKWVRLAVQNNITVPLIGLPQARLLEARARAENVLLSAYIKADCGLSRLGLVIAGKESLAADEVCEMAQLPGLKIHSIMTHLTAGGVAEKDALNREQLTRFDDFCKLLSKRGLILPRHCCASRFAVRYPDFNFEYIRIGSNLFGVHPYYGNGPHFREAMQLKTRIVQIKEVDPGITVGYGPVFTAKRYTRIAVLPIGYVDGLSCRLSNRMHMLTHGVKVPQIGRLCMDYCMIDITDVPEACEGDIVTVFGRDGDSYLSVQEHAALYPGTASEIICLLGKRIPRFYFKDDQMMSQE